MSKNTAPTRHIRFCDEPEYEMEDDQQPHHQVADNHHRTKSFEDSIASLELDQLHEFPENVVLAPSPHNAPPSSRSQRQNNYQHQPTSSSLNPNSNNYLEDGQPPPPEQNAGKRRTSSQTSSMSFQDYLAEQRKMKTMRFEISGNKSMMMGGDSSAVIDNHASVSFFAQQLFHNSNATLSSDNNINQNNNNASMHHHGMYHQHSSGQDVEEQGGTPLSEQAQTQPRRRPLLNPQISSRYMAIGNNGNKRGSTESAASESSLARRLEAISIVGRRQALVSDSAAWKSFMHEMEDLYEDDEEDDEDENGGGGGHAVPKSRPPKSKDHGHGHGTIPFYAAPLQRQRWGDHQSLPHINWGDLFFDLFYVAAAYNLGNMLVSALAQSPPDLKRAFVYFVGIFGPLYNMWETKLVYEARYTVVDYAHRLLEIVRFFFVSFAVLHIKPLEELSNPRQSIETFCLTLSMLMESIVQVLLHFELYFMAQGDRTAIQNHTRRRLYNYIPCCGFYFVATLISGVLYIQGEDDNNANDGYYNSGSGDSEESYGNAGDNDGYPYDASGNNHTLGSEGGEYDKGDNLFDPHLRFLAGADYGKGDDESNNKPWSTSDLPLLFCCVAYISNMIWTFVRKSKLSDGVKLDIRDHFVPSNIDYMIHRYGEWIMLMIGESVLSLLIVGTAETPDYYTVASLGALTVIVLQGLKFESEPSDADSHALWRNIQSGTTFCILTQILSMGLIAFGVSYKIMLTTIYTEHVEEEAAAEEYGYNGGGGDDDHHRRLFLQQYHHRWLAASPSVANDTTAALFCGSLTVVLISLELMVGTHRDARENYKFLFREKGLIEEEVNVQEEEDNEKNQTVIKRLKKKSTWKFNWPIIIITFVKACLIVFLATLNQWKTNPKSLTIAGFLVVSALAVSRIIGWGIVHKRETIRRAITSIKETIRSSTTTSRHGSKENNQSTPARRMSFNDSVSGYVSNSSIAPIDEDCDGASSTSSNRSGNNTYKEILDASFDAIIIINKEGLIQNVNETTLRDFGYEDKSDLLGKNISMLMAEKHAVKHDSYISNFNKQGSKYHIINQERILTAKRKDGSEYPCIVGVRRMAESSDIVGFIRDMSSYQKAIADHSTESTDDKKIV